MESVIMVIKQSLVYLPFDALCIVTDNTHKRYVADNADADVDDDERFAGNEKKGVDSPIQVQCDFHEHVQNEEAVGATHDGTSLPR